MVIWGPVIQENKFVLQVMILVYKKGLMELFTELYINRGAKQLYGRGTKQFVHQKGKFFITAS